MDVNLQKAKEESFKKYSSQNTMNSEKFAQLTLRRRADGTLYKTRLQMIEEYNNSILPYPLKAMFRLDYCKNIIKSHITQSFIFSIPLSFVLAYV